MSTHQDFALDHKIVSRAEWLDARRALLAEEKAFMRQQEKGSTHSIPDWARPHNMYDDKGGKTAANGAYEFPTDGHCACHA